MQYLFPGAPTKQPSCTFPPSNTHQTHWIKFIPHQSGPQQETIPKHVRLFNQLYECFDEVFNLEFPGYNGAIVNMGPVLPPQKKGHVLLYSHDKLSELQEHFDTLEWKGIFKCPKDLNIMAE